METKIVSLKRNTPRLFNADEKFWNNVKYITFYNSDVEVILKRGRPTNYLRVEFFEAIQDPGQLYTEEEKLAIYEEYNCAYRFSKESAGFLSYLYNEAENRGLLKQKEYEIISDVINNKVAQYRAEKYGMGKTK